MSMLIVFQFQVMVQLAYSITQPELNYIANNLDVRVKITDNLRYDGKRHTMIITLTNRGTRPMNMRKVEMFFHSFFMVEPDFLPDPRGYRAADYNIRLHHVNGMLFRAEFLPRFSLLLPNQPREIKLTVQDWAVSKTDVPNNWYITSGKLNPKTLAATAVNDQSFVEDFTDPNQYKRYRKDQYSPFSPLERFDNIKAKDLGSRAVSYAVLPTPKETVFDTARPVRMDSTWVVSAGPSLINEATFLGGKTEQCYTCNVI